MTNDNNHFDLGAIFNGPPAPEPTPKKVIPPQKSALENDELAQAFAANTMYGLMLFALGGDLTAEERQHMLEEAALDAAARFRGRVLAGEVSV